MPSITFYIRSGDQSIERFLNALDNNDKSIFIVNCLKRNIGTVIDDNFHLAGNQLSRWRNIKTQWEVIKNLGPSGIITTGIYWNID